MASVAPLTSRGVRTNLTQAPLRLYAAESRGFAPIVEILHAGAEDLVSIASYAVVFIDLSGRALAVAELLV